MADSFFNIKNDVLTRVNTLNLKELVDSIEELIVNKSRLEKLNCDVHSDELAEVISQEIMITDRIQDAIKNISTVPAGFLFSSINNNFISFIDTENKKIHLEMAGETTQLEISSLKCLEEAASLFIKYLYEMSIEGSEERTTDGKPPEGHIKVSAFSDINNFYIRIEDGGRESQCDTGKIRLMDENEYKVIENCNFGINDKILLSDFKNEIENVKSTVKSMGGSIEFVISNKIITSIQIHLPVSSSMEKAMLVTVGNEDYVLPIPFIDTVLNESSVEINKCNKMEIIKHRDDLVPLIRVADKLGLSPSVNGAGCIVVVRDKEKTAALLIDKLLDEVDIVIKPKPLLLGNAGFFMGETILGDGKVTLVVDIPSLINS